MRVSKFSAMTTKYLKEYVMIIARKPIILLTAVLAAILLVAAAGCTFSGVGNTDKKLEVALLTAEELDYFNGDAFFNGEPVNIRNQFLSSLYDTPKKIDLFQLFYCGSGESEIPTEAETAAVIEKNGWDVVPDCACEKISRANMDAVLTEYMGLTLADTGKTGLESFTYLAEYDAYYCYHGDTNYRGEITFSGGEREGDSIRLFYNDTFMGDGEKVLTLREMAGDYLFISNLSEGVASREEIIRALVKTSLDIQYEHKAVDLDLVYTKKFYENFPDYYDKDNLAPCKITNCG